MEYIGYAEFPVGPCLLPFVVKLVMMFIREEFFPNCFKGECSEPAEALGVEC